MEKLKNQTVLPFLFFCTFAGCQSTEKINETEVDPRNLKFASEIAAKIMEGQKAGTFYEVDETEATSTFADGFGKSVQYQAYHQLHSLFGDYESMKFVEAVKLNSKDEYTIYRFRGKFEKSDPEIRVVLNSEGKIAGFFVKPWKDKI